MPLEFSVLIGLGAVVLCALKGFHWRAFGIVAALAIAVVGVVTIAEGIDEDVVSGLLVLGVPLVIAVGAVWPSLRPPDPTPHDPVPSTPTRSTSPCNTSHANRASQPASSAENASVPSTPPL